MLRFLFPMWVEFLANEGFNAFLFLWGRDLGLARRRRAVPVPKARRREVDEEEDSHFREFFLSASDDYVRGANPRSGLVPYYT